MERFDKNSNPFKVPDGYFNEFAERMSSFAEAEAPTPKVPVKVILRPLAALAAIIAGVAIITFAILQTIPKQHIADNLMPYSEEEIINFLFSEIDNHTLESFAAQELNPSLTTEEEDKEAIVEYLMLSQISINEIITHYDDNTDLK